MVPFRLHYRKRQHVKSTSIAVCWSKIVNFFVVSGTKHFIFNMECLVEESDQERVRNRHVSFDFAPTAIDYQQNVRILKIISYLDSCDSNIPEKTELNRKSET